MKKGCVIAISLVFGVVISSFSQSLNLGFLFNSGVIVGTDYYAPAAINNTTDFQSIKYKFQVNKALKTKIGLDLKGFNLKKMDAKASQIFLNYGFQMNQFRLCHRSR